MTGWHCITKRNNGSLTVVHIFIPVFIYLFILSNLLQWYYSDLLHDVKTAEPDRMRWVSVPLCKKGNCTVLALLQRHNEVKNDQLSIRASFSKLAVQGIKRSGILRWFQKCVVLLRQEDFFSEKRVFAKFSKSLKIKFFCKKIFSLLPNLRLLHIFEISAKFSFFETLHGQFRRNFFSTLIRGGATFFEG